MTEITKPKKDSEIDHDKTSNRTHEGDNLGNSALANSAVTVAGKSVSLGESAGIGHGDLSGIDEADHHTKGVATYVQGTRPSSPGNGETWFEPGTRIYRVWESGKWHSIPPVSATQEVVTFGESNVNINQNKTEIASESIHLGTKLGDTTTTTGDDTSGSTDYGSGVEINPNKDLYGVEVEISSNTGVAQEVFITDSSENILESKTGSFSSGETVQLETSLSSGTNYYVGIYNDGNNYTYGLYDSPSFNYSGADLDVTNGAFYMHPNDGANPNVGDYSRYSIVNVTGLVKATSGDGLVYYNDEVPDDIENWDLVTFQKEADGETVTIDVEDDSGNTLYSDIGPNFDISTVSSSDGIRFRVNLSRNSTGNNPRCTYLARRFTR
jgi:hypothetical protein